MLTPVTFKSILTSFAEDPSDIEISKGRVVANIREGTIDVELVYSDDDPRQLLVIENEQTFPAKSWLLNRIARLPQLADRIMLSTKDDSPFVVPEGEVTADLSSPDSNADKHTSDVLNELLQFATKPLPTDTSVLYITSDAGEGKTTLINKAAYEQAKKFKERKTNSLIVPIPLGGRSFLTFDDATIATLVNRLRFNYLYYNSFIELIRLGAIIPAFDGYEEMLVEGGRDEAVSALGNLINVLDSSGTIFLSARKAFFEYLSFKTQAKLFDAISHHGAVFSRVSINRWNKDQFINYGELRKANNPIDVYNVVSKKLRSNHPLLTRAVLVRRLFDIVGNDVDSSNLVEKLGQRTDDYFHAFIDAILAREVNEKWLSSVAGDVKKPLLTLEEQHMLLSCIASEMWLSSTTSLRMELIEIVVDLFAKKTKKDNRTVRQIKERVKQHALLILDKSKGDSLAFDHEDFLNFYIGEYLGRLICFEEKMETKVFLTRGTLLNLVTEQAVLYLLRNSHDIPKSIQFLMEINKSENGFSYCKQNCGSLIIAMAEKLNIENLHISDLFLSENALSHIDLTNITFEDCYFSTTSFDNSSLNNIEFKNCLFERIELTKNKDQIRNCSFHDCTVNVLVDKELDEPIFNPDDIQEILQSEGRGEIFNEGAGSESLFKSDERFMLFNKLLRIFLRTTRLDEDILKVRYGADYSKFSLILRPLLIEKNIIEEVTWAGRGLQKRYKLNIAMAKIEEEMKKNKNNDFESFLDHLARNNI